MCLTQHGIRDLNQDAAQVALHLQGQLGAPLGVVLLCAGQVLERTGEWHAPGAAAGTEPGTGKQRDSAA